MCIKGCRTPLHMSKDLGELHHSGTHVHLLDLREGGKWYMYGFEHVIHDHSS